jgi:hypothetical protein
VKADSTSDEMVGRVLAGRYRIEALLGMGGMGAVYRAEHVHMRKAVAVKILHREMTQLPEVVARFEREAVAAARITHPNVAAATDFGRLDDGSFYLALEFVEGRSLGQLIKKEGALAEGRALGIARQIAEALAAAHAAGVVHRDLKPENVMLVSREGQPEFVKVLDFGIAKLRFESTGDQPLTQMGVVFGTPEYMSPEQAQGLEVDARADLYTLGVILYEMLAGASPFHHEDLVVVLTRQITVDPPPLPEHVSPATRELVTKLLKKNPSQRWALASEVRERIDTLLALGPASAPLLVPPAAAAPAVAPSAAALPAIAVTADAETVAHGRTAIALPALARHPLSVVGGLIKRLNLGRRFVVGRYAIPLGAALGIGALGVSALLLGAALLFSSPPSHGTSAGAEAPPPPPAPDVLLLVSRAEQGDAAAIATLAARPPNARSLLEWRGIAHGYCRIGNIKACVDVYAEGVAAQPELALDLAMLGDVRRAADHPEVGPLALELAARSLGSAGADLLFDVAEKGKAQSPLVQRARALLEAEPAKGHVSAALRAMMELQLAMKKPRCAELKRWLGERAQLVDERVVPLLTRLQDRRGCGFFGLGDCYACLRAGGELSRTLETAKSRPKPSFGLSSSSAAPTSSGAR